MREERALAAQLDRVLDGRERADGELAALASLLERAAAPSRFEVGAAEVEGALAAALARLRPRLRRPTRVRPVVGGLALAGAVAAVLVVVLTRGSAVPLHVEEPALAALGGPSSVLRVIERVEPTRPGAFPVNVRVGWIDARGKRIRWDEYVRGRKVVETLLEGSRVSRYLIPENVVFVGTSCRAFASGCAELVDPIELYRRALQRSTARTSRTTFDGRAAFVLRLPVQSLPDAVRIEQRVTIDRTTYLPLLIEWVEERSGSKPRAFSRILIKRVREVPAAAVGFAFELNAPTARVIQRVTPGSGLRKLSERRLSLAQAQALIPPLQWLGPDYIGQPGSAIDELRWNAGTAYRIRYGNLLTVWNYGRLVPPEIAASRYVPAKVVPLIDGRIARFYQAQDGRVVLELEGPGRSIALIGPQFGKESLFDALQRLQPLQ
jgi:hypothetical protein